MIAKNKNLIRIEKIKQSIPGRFFYEKTFDTSFRNKILSNIELDYSKVDHNNMLLCSPLLNREQEYHIFRKFNYLRYRIIKLTVGFQKVKIKPYPKPAKPVNLYKLGDKSLSEIEKLIHDMYKIRNLLLESNLRLIIKNLSKHHPTDSFEREEFFSNGYCHVLKAVDCFDYRMGFKFSTYCVNVLVSNLQRDSHSSRKHAEKFMLPEQLEVGSNDGYKDSSLSEINKSYNKSFINQMLNKIKNETKNFDIKIKIIKDYYGLDSERKNLCELGSELGLSKERIRQIKLEALKLLSKVGKELVYDPLV